MMVALTLPPTLMFPQCWYSPNIGTNPNIGDDPNVGTLLKVSQSGDIPDKYLHIKPNMSSCLLILIYLPLPHLYVHHLHYHR